jgi:hypothetical protein
VRKKKRKKIHKGEERTSFGMAVVRREKRNLSMKKKVLEDEKEE